MMSGSLVRNSAAIVLTGGGSGGHTSAAVGIIQALEESGLSLAQMLWIGSKGGVESRVAAASRIPYESVSVGRFRRRLDWRNLIDPFRVAQGFFRSIGLLRRRRPAVVISTGGFVSVPVSLAAALLRIPLVVHEQTIVPGLANRIVGRLSDLIIVSHDDAAKHFRAKRVIRIGNPLRRELRMGRPSQREAFASLGLDSEIPLIYVTGGAQGAAAINDVVAATLPDLLPRWQVVHQCGSKDWLDRLAGVYSGLPPAMRRRYIVRDYVDSEISAVLTAASVVVSRAGAAITNELIRLGIASILIPYPMSINNEQDKLAELLGHVGGAIVIRQSDFSPSTLVSALGRVEDQGERRRMAAAARTLAHADVEQELAATLRQIIK